ncbi:MAG: aspartate aminotransferase family protein [Clostridia bacterium]|nr:aspartate aminotransferase family protein [Clostridia bacterium]
MTYQKLAEMDSKYIANTYGRFEAALDTGRGATCFDVDEKKYIDFTSGIGVNSLGFCDEGWVTAVKNQLDKLQHASNLFLTAPMAELAHMLCVRTGMSKVFFANSGAEANEGAIKAARKYSFDKYGPGRNKIVTLINSFHGRTVTTLSATGQDSFHQFFFPFTEGFVFAPADDLKATLDMLSDDVCAVMLETVQGEGGVMKLDGEYVKGVYDACREKDILLVIDEVQTGMGRTGTLISCEQFKVSPDIVTCAKGLGGGLPIGAVLLSEKLADTFHPGQHGSTFGGNPVVCAGACEILRRLDDRFLASVREKGEYIKDKLEKIPGVKSVSGLGMMIGVELEKANNKAVAARCVKNGLLVLTAKEKIRFLPPLNISHRLIDEGLKIFEQSIAECEGV